MQLAAAAFAQGERHVDADRVGAGHQAAPSASGVGRLAKALSPGMDIAAELEQLLPPDRARRDVLLQIRASGYLHMTERAAFEEAVHQALPDFSFLDLRDHVNPDCGVILVHQTKKLSKHQVKEDPFLALSGTSALRGFYPTGLILHRPDEEATERKLEIELRNGPALSAKLANKVKGEWVEINPMDERLVRAEQGAKFDAERDRKGEVIVDILFEEAAMGRLYTTMQFGAAFENQHGLGSQYTIIPSAIG